MKHQPSDSAWQRLVAASRQIPDDRDTTAPYGFSTRIASLAACQPATPSLSFALDRFSLRALALACLIMTTGLVSSYSLSASSADEEDVANQDLVSEIINQS